jgi:DtxR family transcriptional regulator, Mn-dependent transcriptional regulator
MAVRGTHARHERHAPASEAIEDYAKAIYALARRKDGPVGTSELADRLGVTPASTTAMLKRLDEMGLVSYERYKGVTLTRSGEKIALEVIRHHRLLESYLSEALGMPWDKVHEEAEVLEHYISEDLEDLLAAKLGQPERDPHGDPIPAPDLSLPPDEGKPLDTAEAGERGTLTRVSDSDPEMLRYLTEHGIQVGTKVKVLANEPFGAGVRIAAGGEEHVIGGELARRLVIAAS